MKQAKRGTDEGREKRRPAPRNIFSVVFFRSMSISSCNNIHNLSWEQHGDCVLFLCVTSSTMRQEMVGSIHIQCTMWTQEQKQTHTHTHRMNTINRCFMSVLLVRFNKNLWTSISIVLNCFFVCSCVCVCVRALLVRCLSVYICSIAHNVWCIC